MSGIPLQYPFNFHPVNTGRGTQASSYTVPAGKYARVIITLSVTAYFTNASSGGSAADVLSHSDGSETVSFETYMTAGEQLTFSATAASASDTVGSGLFNVNDGSVVTALIDGSSMAAAKCRAGAFGYLGTGTHNLTLTGTAEAYFRYEEHNIPT